jgi:hypothetical protein
MESVVLPHFFSMLRGILGHVLMRACMLRCCFVSREETAECSVVGAIACNHQRIGIPTGESVRWQLSQGAFNLRNRI